MLGLLTPYLMSKNYLLVVGFCILVHVLSVINASYIGFILGTPHHIYRFLATSEEEKNSWFTTLHKMIFAQKQLFSKVSGVNTVM